jgi:hypothetical protein
MSAPTKLDTLKRQEAGLRAELEVLRASRSSQLARSSTSEVEEKRVFRLDQDVDLGSLQEVREYFTQALQTKEESLGVKLRAVRALDTSQKDIAQEGTSKIALSVSDIRTF